MQYTPNFSLKLPGAADMALIGDLNQNTSSLDTLLLQLRLLSCRAYDPNTTASNAYQKNDLVIYSNVMYRCDDDDVYGAWDSSKWVQTDIATELKRISSGGGGTDVEANPSGTATDTLTKLRVDNDIYSVSGGGTTVVANPSGTPTDTLETVQIGADIYEIVGSGGGSSYEEVTLWSGSTAASTSGNLINLSEPITNFDAIYLVVGSGTSWYIPAWYITSQLTVGGHYVGSVNADIAANWYLTSVSSITITSMSSSNKTTYSKVVGIKFSGGGGYTKDILWSGNEYPSASGTTIILNGNISDYDEIYIGVKDANYGGDNRFDTQFMTVGETYISTLYADNYLGAYFTYDSDTQITIKSQSSSHREYYTHVLGVKY